MSAAAPAASRPLSGQELDRLELMLDGGDYGWEPMPLDMLQGFLCGIASAPESIAPQEWLPRALGAPVWPDPRAETAEWGPLLERLFRQQIRALEGEEDASLVFYEDTPGTSNKFEHWCIGYLDAIDFASEAWDAAGLPEEIDELLFPFQVLANALAPQERARIGDKEWRKFLEECSADLWPATVSAYKYGLALRNRPVTVRRDTPRIGRNEPCACGSGRKFKNCCGKGRQP